MTKIGIIGCAGRMGQALIREVSHADSAQLCAGIEREGSDALGKDVGTLAGLEPVGIETTSDLATAINACDCFINFTLPEPTLETAEVLAEHGKPVVIGTTGLDTGQLASLKTLAERTPILHSHNMSVGVNMLLGLVKQTAAALPADIFDIDVLEMHHRNKVDAPSGTALSLGEAAADGRDVELSRVACKSRDGQVGPRPEGEIGFATLRGGDVVGDHTVIFASDLERIELTHKAQSRDVFAHGAVRAAKWLSDKPNGLYGMGDMLGL